MTTPTIIFHQYAMSPFSEKIRKVFAHKGLEYRSVEQPAWMPKKHLTPLTAGYRRIPVLQIGADVYCDSALIARELERRRPAPSIYPDSGIAACEAFEQWADRSLFMKAVPLVFTALADAIPSELLEDRKKMAPQFNIEALRAVAPACRAAVNAQLGTLAKSLSKRDYLLGDTFSLADAAVFHCLWFVRGDAETAERLASLPALARWFERIDAMGEGPACEMSPEQALTEARQSEPALLPDAAPFPADAKLEIWSDDLPADRFRGRAMPAREDEIVLAHRSEETGRVAIHFPRVGCSFRVLR